MFDVLTVAAVADELTATLLDGRIQKVGLIDRSTLGFEIYAGKRLYLVASAENDQPRLLLVREAPSLDSQLVTPLLLLLRKYVRGGLVVGVETPPLERVVRLSIAKRLTPHNAPDEAADTSEGGQVDDEDDPEGIEGATYVHLVFEIMGRHSNILMVDDDGVVMESIKRVTHAMSRVRPVAPRLAYVPPPLDERGDPRRLSTAEAAMLLAAERPEARLAKVLPSRLRGISPQMAREIAFASAGSIEATVGDARGDGGAAMARATRQLLEPLLTSRWDPHVYREGGEVVAFAAVPLAHLGAELEPEGVPSMSAAAAMTLGGGGEATPGRHGARRERLVAAIREARERAAVRLGSLQGEAAKADEAERYRRWGEAIYAYLWSIKPGMSEFDADGELIPLDPALTAKENAQELFERYRKAQSAGEHLPELIARAATEIAYLDQLSTLASQSETFPELEDVRVEWEAHAGAKDAPGGKRRPRSTPPRRTRPVIDAEGNAIYVGRSGAENDRITFDIAGPNDTWLHARGVPGSHVIVRWANAAGEENEATLERAARLAAHYSSARDSGAVEVDITRRRHVRKLKGTGPGMVTYRNERTIAVRPGDEDSLGLSTKT
jgi:predicted ribosome quality control (RQC) complex YloA/Tae2 family protein